MDEPEPDEWAGVPMLDVYVGKPLHVRVAEALGCKPARDRPSGRWYCGDGEDAGDCSFCRPGGDGWIPQFDTDWSATGPLIEKYGISVCPSVRKQEIWENDWEAVWPGAVLPEIPVRQLGGTGPAPLVAVCNLLLALKASGKLPE